MWSKVTAFVKKEIVLCISFICALISCLFVPPSAAYLEYIDLRVLVLLGYLMAAVAGLTQAGLLDRLSAVLLKKAKTQRALCLVLTLLCFFSSMVMTNDVALVTFVPLTILILAQAGLHALLIPVITMETVAANLGSALTPVGNPQNLHLFSYYGLSTGEFFAVTLPLCAASLVLVVAAVFTVKTNGTMAVILPEPKAMDKKRLLLHGTLLVLSLLTVFSVLDWRILLLIVVAALLVLDRGIFKKVDYALLLTFVCFFIFSGNLAAIPAVRGLLTSLMDKSAFFASLAASQVISNVPSALLLSPFTDNAAAMILGTDVGGLGTIVASLASLISYKFYANSAGANSGKYLLYFTVVNVILLIPLIVLAVVML